MWTGRKPSLRHLYVWGCPAEARIYNPYERKLDSRTVSDYFIGYPEKSKGCIFYYPKYSPRIVETRNARFIKNGDVSGSDEQQSMEIKEISVNVPLHMNVPSSITLPNVIPSIEGHNDNTEQHLNKESSHQTTNSHMTNANEPQEIVVRRSQRERRSAIPNDYVVYLQKVRF